MNQLERMPELSSYPARNGSELYFRHYPADTDRVMILLHGISEDGKYLRPLAEYLSSRGLAQVYTPDLRGYGRNPERRGDVDYVGQIDDDLEDLVQWIVQRQPRAEIVMAGHSAGGGTAIRIAPKPFAPKYIRAYLLLAPLVGPNAPTERKGNSDGFIRLNMPRVIGLMLLNALGIRLWNGATVMRINRPEESRHGGETLSLSYRLLMSRSPGMKYRNDLRALKQPTLVLIGEEDEVFLPEQYEPVFSKYTQAKVRLIPKQNHDGLLSCPMASQAVAEWLDYTFTHMAEKASSTCKKTRNGRLHWNRSPLRVFISSAGPLTAHERSTIIETKHNTNER